MTGQARLTDDQLDDMRRSMFGKNVAVRRLLDEIEALRAERDAAYDVLRDLVDYTDCHRLSYEAHDHDCYQEWNLLRDEARSVLPERRDQGDK